MTVRSNLTHGSNSVAPNSVDLVIVGAGPCGLAAGIAALRSELSTVVYDRGPIVAGLASYPTYMTFFSTPERLEIGDVPFIIAEEKPSRRDALAYYRAVASKYDLPVRQYETVETISEAQGDKLTPSGLPVRWRVNSVSASGKTRSILTNSVCIATGYFGRPNMLGIDGEDLPHVRHGYSEGHGSWRETVVVVGGGNSAVDAALELMRCEAKVHLVHFGEDLDGGVKPWVRPVIANRIHDEAIIAHFGSRVTAIDSDHVTILGPDGEKKIEASQVFLLTGYLPETGLLASLGVPIDAVTGVPEHNPVTMATPVAGVYLAGVIASGLDANRIFIENGRDHGSAIVADIARSLPN